MRCENTIVRERQLVIRRELDRRGVSLKAVALDSGLPYSSVISYFPGERDREPATISGAAVYALCDGKALPADLLSLLLPDGWQIVRAPECVDHDALCEWAEGYVHAKTRAHRQDSPMGPEIAPCEQEELDGKVAAFPVKVAA